MTEMLIVKLIVLSLCSICKLIGELSWHNAQRFVMPIVLALGICIILHSFWLGFCVIPMIAPLCIGYSDYGKSDGFDRAIWLFLICIASGIILALLGHLPWLFYVPWCILSAVWGGITRMWWNMIIAPISGLIIGCLILFVR